MLTDLSETSGTTGLPRLNMAFAWIESRRSQIVIAAIVFQFVLLGAMIVKSAIPLITGNTYLVKVVPVDPRDLFRGDYVILGYDFSRLPGNVNGLVERDSRTGQPIFVTLVPDKDGKHWKAGKFSIERPASGVYLEGVLTNWGRVEYGIESFFVQEGQGRKYENAIRSQGLSAEIAVDSHGKAALKRLVIE